MSGVRVYPVGEEFVVADDGGWVPGAFDTPETARRAADLAWGPLMQEYGEMQVRVNSIYHEGRAITQADLDALERKEPPA